MDSTWSDRFTPYELAAMLELYAVRIAKVNGWYEMANEMRDAADALRDLHDDREMLRRAGDDLMRQAMAVKESLTAAP